MRYSCQTLFDITATGVTGHYKPATQMSSVEWNQARNQQRNWETLQQIISLRTQIFDLNKPVVQNGRWTFEFEVETAGVYGPATDPTQVLRQDANGVPMIADLTGPESLPPMLITSGTDQNIWFECLAINNR